MGRPLYGDVFGLDHPGGRKKVQPEQEVDQSLWGELESEEESEEESEVGGDWLLGGEAQNRIEGFVAYCSQNNSFVRCL